MRLSRLLLFVFRLKDICVFETAGWFLRPLAPCVLIQLCWTFLGGREELVVVDEGDDGHVKEPEGWRWLCLCIVYDEVVEVKWVVMVMSAMRFSSAFDELTKEG
jgi:hypothetical protein